MTSGVKKRPGTLLPESRLSAPSTGRASLADFLCWKGPLVGHWPCFSPAWPKGKPLSDFRVRTAPVSTFRYGDSLAGWLPENKRLHSSFFSVDTPSPWPSKMGASQPDDFRCRTCPLQDLLVGAPVPSLCSLGWEKPRAPLSRPAGLHTHASRGFPGPAHTLWQPRLRVQLPSSRRDPSPTPLPLALFLERCPLPQTWPSGLCYPNSRCGAAEPTTCLQGQPWATCLPKGRGPGPRGWVGGPELGRAGVSKKTGLVGAGLVCQSAAPAGGGTSADTHGSRQEGKAEGTRVR